ncbi:hypothetical protein GCK72_002725 [Caenorhabditis remanei]|uniref:Uncharacterized protein n=1 Tax=Caenorhabditis remanei TaxID=31234 RepID=A0A6A5HUR6_CAERE|nr:hypothetical protein GCK72_002725 [Caenorhabditis remanei]KAF1770901.1 hypothetical protein GCK72_002725 [Caenorhabditis remanei]
MDGAFVRFIEELATDSFSSSVSVPHEERSSLIEPVVELLLFTRIDRPSLRNKELIDEARRTGAGAAAGGGPCAVLFWPPAVPLFCPRAKMARRARAMKRMVVFWIMVYPKSVEEFSGTM